jgi:hypothetical protein
LGENALLPFEAHEDWDPGFDFGDIFGGQHLTIVPVADQPLEPRRPKCQADVGSLLNRPISISRKKCESDNHL